MTTPPGGGPRDFYVGASHAYAEEIRAARRRAAEDNQLPPPLPVEVPLPPSPRPSFDELRQLRLAAVRDAAQDHSDAVRAAITTAPETAKRRHAVDAVIRAGTILDARIRQALQAGLTPEQLVDGAAELHHLYVEDLLKPLR